MSCYFLIGVFFSFVYSAQNGCALSFSGAVLRSSGTVLNYDDPEIKYNFVNKILYSGNGDKPFPFNDTLQDVCYLSTNQFIVRSVDKNYTTFALIKDGKECNSFSTFDNSQLPDNQKYIVDAWGAQKIKKKILVAWVEIFIKVKNINQSIKNLIPMKILEMYEMKTNDFHMVSADLKVFDISSQVLLKNSPLEARVPVSFPIEQFPLGCRYKRFPYKILFSPDSKCVIIQTSSGFVLQSLIPAYPLLQAEVFSFPDVLSSHSGEEIIFFQDFTIKWISNKKFLFIAYTNFVDKFLRYSKYGPGWWSDKESDDMVNCINKEIEKFNSKQEYLLKLRFCNLKDALKVRLLGIFLGVPEEQVIVDIPIEY